MPTSTIAACCRCWSRRATAARSTPRPAPSSWRRWSCSTRASSRRNLPSARRAGRSGTRTWSRPTIKRKRTSTAPRSTWPRPGSTWRRPSNPCHPRACRGLPRRPGRRRTRRPTCERSRRTWSSTWTSRSTRPRTPRRHWPSSGRFATARSSRSRRGSTPPSSTPGTSSARRSSACGSARREGGEERVIVCSGDLGRPGHADPARPDPGRRRRLRPRGIDLRRPRARARGRGDPGPGRDDPDGRRGGRRAARPVVRDRANPGGRLGARSADRAGRDPAAAALSRFADGVQGVRHLSPPPRLLRRGDREAAARGRQPARLPEPDHHQRREAVASRSSGRPGRT